MAPTPEFIPTSQEIVALLTDLNKPRECQRTFARKMRRQRKNQIFFPDICPPNGHNSAKNFGTTRALPTPTDKNTTTFQLYEKMKN